MKSSKDVPSPKKPVTTKDELKFICQKIADLDALWRINDIQEPPPLKRAA